jgi:hypothetical protein
MEQAEKIKTNTFKGKDPVITKKNLGRSIHSVVDGSFLTRDKVVGLVPFLIFLLFLAILYISNIYYAEKSIREIDDTKEELKELQYEFITSKSELMSKSKRSEIARMLESEGINESTIPPGRLYIKDAESKQETEQHDEP